MLKSLNIRNLTAFAEADLEFSPQLNVIVGENAVGKSHLLKVPYAVLATSAEEGRKPNGGARTKASLQAKLADKRRHLAPARTRLPDRVHHGSGTS